MTHKRQLLVRPAEVRRGILLITAAVALSFSACTGSRISVQADSPEMAEWIELVMPARIKILEWTKPVSLAGDGNADGIEVILAARDSFDDLTKVLGTLHFELQTRRLSQRIGTRVSFWPVEMDSAKTMRPYLDHPTGFYRFRLQLEECPLPPGRYVLIARLHLPTDRSLVDRYEFTYDGGGVPAIRPL